MLKEYTTAEAKSERIIAGSFEAKIVDGGGGASTSLGRNKIPQGKSICIFSLKLPLWHMSAERC